MAAWKIVRPLTVDRKGVRVGDEVYEVPDEESDCPTDHYAIGCRHVKPTNGIWVVTAILLSDVGCELYVLKGRSGIYCNGCFEPVQRKPAPSIELSKKVLVDA